MRPRSSGARLGVAIAWLAAVGALVVGIVSLLGLGIAGPLALVSILAAHLLLACLVAAAVGLLIAKSWSSALRFGVVLVISIAVLGTDWVSLPSASTGGRSLAVTTWNLELGSAAADDLATTLATSDADLVALQELTGDAVTAIDNAPAVLARFPYRSLHPDRGVFGLGLLSRYPILDAEAHDDPSTLTARIDLGEGAPIAVTVAHPLPGRITTATPLRLPLAFDPTDRDESLRVIRSRAEVGRTDGGFAILLGDFNVSPSEIGFARLIEGWRDVHREVGVGPGWTWRPSRLEGLGLGFLGIDHVLVTPDIEPESIGEDCSHAGDHCLVTSRLRLPSS